MTEEERDLLLTSINTRLTNVETRLIVVETRIEPIPIGRFAWQPLSQAEIYRNGPDP